MLVTWPAARGMHTKNQTTNLGVPERIGAISGLSCENNALGEGR